MLKTLEYTDYSKEDIKESFPEFSEDKVNQMVELYETKILQPGILITSLNFDHSIISEIEDEFNDLIVTDGVLTGVIDLYNSKMTFEERMELREQHELFGSYGVCDSYEQVIDRFGLNESELEVTVSLTPIYKNEQSETGGWRWHKWGEYIGDKTITSEYLYEEEDIDLVYVYQVFVLKTKI